MKALLTAIIGALAVFTVPLYASYGALEVLTIGSGVAAIAIGLSALLALDYDWYPFITALFLGLATFPVAYAGYVAVGFIPLSIPLNGIYIPAVFGAAALSFPLGLAASRRQQTLVLVAIGVHLVSLQRILSQVGGTPLRQEPADFALIAMAGIVLFAVLLAIFIPGYRLGRSVRRKQSDSLPSQTLPLAGIAALFAGLLAWLLHLGITHPLTGLNSYGLVVGIIVLTVFVVSYKLFSERKIAQ